MTLKYDSAFSPRDALEFCSNIRPLPTEGAVLPREGSRECRTLDAPAASRVEKNTRVSHHGHAGTPGIPRAMVLTVSFVLSPVIGLYCHRRFAKRPRNLTPASRRQDHTTSPSASAPFVKSASASTASRPASVTIASRPSGGTRRAQDANDLGGAKSRIFFAGDLDTPNHVELAREISF